jgi:hypothetical protein
VPLQISRRIPASNKTGQHSQERLWPLNTPFQRTFTVTLTGLIESLDTLMLPRLQSAEGVLLPSQPDEPRSWELDAIIVLSQGSEYAGTVSTGNAFTSGNFYPGGFNATTTGTRVSVPLMFGKAQVLAIKWG